MGLAVDGGAPGALADDQRVGVGEAGAHGGGQRTAARGAEVLALLGAAHDPERGAGDSLEERFAAGALREVVAAVADEGEMAVGDPAQERRDLVAIGVRRRGFGEFAHGGVERAAHGAPIGDGAADVLEDVRQARRQRGGVGGVLAADLDADGGFDSRIGRGGGAGFAQFAQRARCVAARAPGGVGDEADGDFARVQFCGERVDDERAVVGDQIDDRAGGGPAVALRVGVVNSQFVGAGPAFAHEGEHALGGAAEAFRASAVDVLRRRAAVEPADEQVARGVERGAHGAAGAAAPFRDAGGGGNSGRTGTAAAARGRAAREAGGTPAVPGGDPGCGRGRQFRENRDGGGAGSRCARGRRDAGAPRRDAGGGGNSGRTGTAAARVALRARPAGRRGAQAGCGRGRRFRENRDGGGGAGPRCARGRRDAGAPRRDAGGGGDSGRTGTAAAARGRAAREAGGTPARPGGMRAGAAIPGEPGRRRRGGEWAWGAVRGPVGESIVS